MIDHLGREHGAVTSLIRACQIAVGDTLSWQHWPELGKMSIHFEGIPAPTTSPEIASALGVAIRFSQNLASRAHRHVHALNQSGCSFQPPPIPLPTFTQGHADVWNPGQALIRWLALLDRSLRETHQEDLVSRARRRLASPDCPPIGSLGRELGCSPRRLQRLFFQSERVSMIDYRVREQVAAAVVLIAAGEKVESVALRVGWGSKKGLYDGFARFDLTVAAVRRLTIEQATALAAQVHGQLAAIA
jgi:AraC-like DNA-binding protein